MNAARRTADTSSNDERSVDMQHQQESSTTNIGYRTARFALGAFAVATAAVVGGALVGSRDPAPAPAVSGRGALSADAAERWVEGSRSVGSVGSADALERWVEGSRPVGSVGSADALERWVEGSRPVVEAWLSADAAERWAASRHRP
jgi:transcription elongation factor